MIPAPISMMNCIIAIKFQMDSVIMPIHMTMNINRSSSMMISVDFLFIFIILFAHFDFSLNTSITETTGITRKYPNHSHCQYDTHSPRSGQESIPWITILCHGNDHTVYQRDKCQCTPSNDTDIEYPTNQCSSCPTNWDFRLSVVNQQAIRIIFDMEGIWLNIQLNPPLTLNVFVECTMSDESDNKFLNFIGDKLHIVDISGVSTDNPCGNVI